MEAKLISSPAYHFGSGPPWGQCGVCITHYLCVAHNNTEHVSFHWLFSESHHGKGKHDRHGAIVKHSIRTFILKGIESLSVPFGTQQHQKTTDAARIPADIHAAQFFFIMFNTTVNECNYRGKIYR